MGVGAAIALSGGLFRTSSILYSAGGIAQTQSDDHADLQALKAANISMRITVAEVSIKKLEDGQSDTNRFLYSLDNKLAVLVEKVSSFDDKLALVASKNLPRGRN